MSDARQRWTERFARYSQARQTVAAFCAQEGVSVPSFYNWKRKLAELTPLVPIQLTSSPVPTQPLELVLPSGIRLRFPEQYSPDQLARLIASLEARSC
jgi:transposase